MSGVSSLGISSIEPLEYQAYLLAQLFEQHLQLGKIQEVRQVNKVGGGRQVALRNKVSTKERVVTNVSVDAKSFLQRGIFKVKTGRYDEAIEDFNHALRIDPNFAAAYVSRADAYIHKGDVRSASHSYDQAISALSRLEVDSCKVDFS